MAARKKKWDFYVYAIGSIDSPHYVGKGSGRRLKNQIRKFGMAGQEIARFYSEKEAYKFEVEAISSLKPVANKHVGGNGSCVQRKRRVYCKWESEINRIGSRVYAARVLLGLNTGELIGKSTLEKIRQVAYG